MYFYSTNIPTVLNQAHTIQGEEAGHLLVMRVQRGQVLTLCNLNGTVAIIKILDADKKTKKIEYEILEINSSSKDTKTQSDKVLFQSLLSKDYMEKMYEILPLSQFDKIFIFRTRYSVNNEANPINWERLHRILIRSCEQSERVFLPEIVVLDNKEELELQLKKYLPTVMDCNVNSRDTKKNKTSNSAVLIGPEGGFDDAEREYYITLGLGFNTMGTQIYPAWIAGLVSGERLN